MKTKLIFFIAFLGTSLASFSQTDPFNLRLEPVTIPELKGIQSFAVGEYEGKWLIMGGRLDGLHRRQPFAAFDEAGNNNQILVVDPTALKKWSAPLTSLPIAIQEQLSSTNMEFYQEGDFLYLIGGYGYSKTIGDHTTYPNLTAVKVPQVINAIINGSNFTSAFRQIKDSIFAVTGGYLNKIYNTYYITGGQRFEGRYNPMGPDHGPGFVQIYTNAIRKFTISDDGVTLKVNHLPAIVDSKNLHRRDYNVVPQILPNGREGITAFSGVFQENVDLPYLNSVNIDSSGYAVNEGFSQYYNHYHCAHIPLFSASGNKMHTVFFGGIAQYYDSANILVQDNDVPFVKTIARVSRDAKGKMSEFKMPLEMPSFLGAGSEFIPIHGLEKYPNGVINLDKITGDTTLVGYVFGGISSSSANIFFTNTGVQSSASDILFKVYLIKNAVSGIHQLNKQSQGSLHMQVYPNPSDGDFAIMFNLNKQTDVIIKISDLSGKIITTETYSNLNVGENLLTFKNKKLRTGKVYMVTLETPYEQCTQKVVVNP